MKRVSILLAISAASVCACSSISVRQTAAPMAPAPTAELAVELPPPDPLILKRIAKARELKLAKDFDGACEIWKDLSSAEKPSIVPRLARVRALETCPAGTKLEGPLAPPQTSEILSSATEPWLREALLRASFAHATRVGDREREAELAIALAPKEQGQGAQLRRAERAIEIAKELKDEELETKARALREKIAPRFSSDPPPNRLLTVAMDYRRARLFDRAREVYGKVTASSGFSDEEKLRAKDGIRMAYKLEKKTDRYIQATREYSDFARHAFLAGAKSARKHTTRLAKYLDTRLTLAKAVWTEGAPAEAASILVEAERDLKGRYPIDESLFIRARIHEEAGRYKDAVRLLDKVASQRGVDRGLRSKALWYLAWNLRRLDRPKHAVEVLEKLIEEEASSNPAGTIGSIAARNHFWLARAMIETKEPALAEKAKAELEWLAAMDPLGYYGLLAHRELKRPLPALFSTVETRGPASALARTTNPMAPPDALAFDWLLQAGEHDLARRLLDDRAPRKLNDAQMMDILQLYARTGEYKSLFGRLSDLSSETRRAVVEKDPSLLFPTPWRDVVTSSSAKHGIRPELVFAIMRQESSFDAAARSHADAFGLMQIIPEVARQEEGRSGIKIESPEDLYRPEINIPMGAAHLRGLHDRWRSGFIGTVASYNASERAVNGWIKSRYKGDPVQFIEDIPYEETRQYVKLVMRNFVFYSRLNSPTSETAFPEWCLEAVQGINQ